MRKKLDEVQPQNDNAETCLVELDDGRVIALDRRRLAKFDDESRQRRKATVH